MKTISSTHRSYHLSVNGQYVTLHTDTTNGREYLCDFDAEKVALLVANNGDDAKLREDLAHLAKGHMELKAALEAIQKETAKRLDAGDGVARDAAGDAYKQVQELRKELDEMPGGYRNSQDIKHLKGRIERLEAKDPSVYDDRIAKLAARVSDIEVCVQGIRANKFATVKEMREADDHLANSIDHRALEISKANQRIDELEKLLQNGNRVTVHSRLYDLDEEVDRLKQSNEQRKKDIVHVTNLIEEFRSKCDAAVGYAKSAERKANGLIIADSTSPLFTKVCQLEECCKNTVASGKALEEKVNNMQRQYQETLNYIREFNADLTPRVKAALQNILRGM